MIGYWKNASGNASGLRPRILDLGMMVMMLVTMMMMMVVRVQMEMRTQGVTIRFHHAGPRMRMRQSLTQHEKRNQQQ